MKSIFNGLVAPFCYIAYYGGHIFVTDIQS